MDRSSGNVVTINNQEYRLSDLSREARDQLASLRVCEIEIQRLKARLAITETARHAYMRALNALLPNPGVTN